MMTKHTINKLEPLTFLSSLIKENFSSNYDLSNMEIIFTVKEDVLKRINEDMFYACNPASMNFPDEVDEINLEINEIKIKYITEEG